MQSLGLQTALLSCEPAFIHDGLNWVHQQKRSQQIDLLQKWNSDSQKPQEREDGAATSQCTFQNAQKYVFACMCAFVCVCIHKGSNTGSLWPQKHHLGAGRASSVGRSEQEHTSCILVCTLAHLVYTDPQQQFLGTGAFSDSTASPALRWTSPCTSPQPCFPDTVPGTRWVLTSAKSMSRGRESWCLRAVGEPRSETLCSLGCATVGFGK